MDYMKMDYMTKAYLQKYDRQQEVKAARKERNSRRNWPHYDELRMEHYNQRQGRKVLLRHLHLARSFVQEQKYKCVENMTRQGNEPDLDLLLAVLYQYGYEPNPSYVERWYKNVG